MNTSEQTEWNDNMKQLPEPLQRCMMALLLEIDASIVHSITDEIVKALASERTRLLSVESMKMEEETYTRAHFDNGRYLKTHKNTKAMIRNLLRQSILSEMEKGSV